MGKQKRFTVVKAAKPHRLGGHMVDCWLVADRETGRIAKGTVGSNAEDGYDSKTTAKKKAAELNAKHERGEKI